MEKKIVKAKVVMAAFALPVLAAFFAMCTCAAYGAEPAPSFKMMVKGRPQVCLERMSYDQTIVHALDEFIAYMNAALKTTDYNGREGLFTLALAVAGDGSCELADETMAKNGHSRETLGREGFLLAQTSDRHYMLAAYSSRGVLNGVYKMFEKAFGVVATRPLAGLEWPDRAGSAAEIPLPYSEKPVFEIRGIRPVGWQATHPSFNMNAWFSRVLMTYGGGDMLGKAEKGWGDAPYGFTAYLGGHIFHRLIPAREYAKTHPEYFSLVDGKRNFDFHGSQISLGNPEVIDIIVKRLVEFRREHSDVVSLPFGYNDTWKNPKNRFGWSEDPQDCKMDSPNDFPKPGSKRPRTWSTRYIKAANEVVRRVNKVWPGTKLQVYAYHFCMLQPPDCEIDPNLIVSFAPLYKCCHHPIFDKNCPRNRFMDECLRGWAAKTKNIYIRDYYSCPNRNYSLMPLYEVVDEVRYYRRLGLMGMNPETRADGPNGSNVQGFMSNARFGTNASYERYWDSNALTHFTLARLAWNPDEKLEDIVALFCRNYYGAKIAPHMAKYFLLKDANIRKSSHPGEKSPDDDPNDDSPTRYGKWCFAWNWNSPIGRYAERLFMTTSPKEVTKNALPLLEPLYEARKIALALRDPVVRERVEAEYELMKLYLLSFGCELNEHKNDKPRFMRIGREDNES